MAPALDHLVLATRDLSGLAAGFAELGFTVSPRNRHPWGTENHIIQFRSSFLELVGLGDGYRTLAPADDAYPFAGFVEHFLERHANGLAMAVLRSSDAGADAARFMREGLGSGRLLPFSRAARSPDGSDRTVAFTLAFAEAPSTPEIGFFSCEQHRPENFWNPALQDHLNGAVELTGFTIVADEPEAHAAFLAGFAGQANWKQRQDGIAIDLDGGEMAIVSATQAGQAGAPQSDETGARIGLAVVRVRDLRSASGRLAHARDWTVATRGSADAVLARWRDGSFALQLSETPGP